jgi:isocitrate lyase
MNGLPAGQAHHQQQQQQPPLFNLHQQQQHQSSNHNELDNFNYISQSLQNASLRPFIEGIAAAAAASSLGTPGPSASLPPASLVGSVADSSYNSNNNHNYRQYENSNSMNSAQDQYNQSQNQPGYNSGKRVRCLLHFSPQLRIARSRFM